MGWEKELKTPKLTVDAIVEVKNKIILISRKNPPLGWALPGGFVDVGESVEDAVRREMREEINIELENLKQFHVYSEPSRDPRFHTVSVVFTASSQENPFAGDDAEKVAMFTKAELQEMINKKKITFDHDMILSDYLETLK